MVLLVSIRKIINIDEIQNFINSHFQAFILIIFKFFNMSGKPYSDGYVANLAEVISKASYT